MFWKNRNTAKQDITTSQGFEEVYNLYWDKVYAVCFHSTEDQGLAENMTQDIFKSLWERKAGLVIEKSIEHYLVRAAKQKVAEHFRNQAIRKKHLERNAQDYNDAADCTEHDVALANLIDELGLLVDQLPSQCQNVFRLSRESGLTNKQIATKLQITERAVEYHISKALGFLKAHLSEYQEVGS
ncbi:MAG: RNA polymerase sigma-70 factor [Bacteroidota bacterium]